MSTVSEKIKNRPSACLDGTISVYEKAIPANTHNCDSPYERQVKHMLRD